MISLEGLTLVTRATPKRGWILRTFAHYIRYGLIPNMFPEGENEGLYHTADATLWFFHALDRYVEYTNDSRHSASHFAEAHRSPPSITCAGRVSVSEWIPRTVLLRARRGEDISTHLDGRKSGQLGRHTAARQGR